MNEDALTLTTYFDERDRTPDGLLADRLAAIYGAQGLRASVLLRGFEGFGRFRHPHSDRLLTLSENLPAVSIAVDVPARIEAARDELLRLRGRGLITLERSRLLSGEIGTVGLPAELDGATKLTVYLRRRQRVSRTPASVAVCELLHRRAAAGATVLLGVDGTHRGRRARARFFGANADVPVMVVAVGAGESIAQLLPELGELLADPLVTLERVRICKRSGALLAAPEQLPARDEHGRELWQKLTVYSSQDATHEGRPLHIEIVGRLRAAGAAGATSVRGVWGFHGASAPHGDRFLAVRRHVPVVTVALDTPARTAASFAIIDELTAEHGLVTSEMVPALAAMDEPGSAGAVRLARHSF